MRFKAAPCLEKLRDNFAYDPLTGVFSRKTSPIGWCKVGDIAGTVNSHGYIVIEIDGVFYGAHRLAWFYVTGEWPKSLIDHIDGIKRNNIFANLREATRRQNAQNALRQGYSFNQSRPHPKKYQATIFVDGKLRHLGFFMTADEARETYLAATERYFGEFSVLNREKAA